MDNTGHGPDGQAELAQRALPEELAELVGEVSEAPPTPSRRGPELDECSR